MVGITRIKAIFSQANMTERQWAGTLLAIDIVETKRPGMIEISSRCGVILSPGTCKIKWHQTNSVACG